MLAIYAVRLELNCGLKNAKDIVDNLTPEHLSITAPEL
jgi:ribosomal protein L7/L12